MDLEAVERKAEALGHALGVWREAGEGVAQGRCAFGPCRAVVEVTEAHGAVGPAVERRCGHDRVAAANMRGPALDPGRERRTFAGGERGPVMSYPASMDRAPRTDAPASWPDFVVQLRRKLGLSQTALAERFGLSGASVTNWEKGHNGVARQHRPVLIEMGKKAGIAAPPEAPPPPRPVGHQPNTSDAAIEAALRQGTKIADIIRTCRAKGDRVRAIAQRIAAELPPCACGKVALHQGACLKGRGGAEAAAPRDVATIARGARTQGAGEHAPEMRRVGGAAGDPVPGLDVGPETLTATDRHLLGIVLRGWATLTANPAVRQDCERLAEVFA